MVAVSLVGSGPGCLGSIISLKDGGKNASVSINPAHFTAARLEGW